VADRRHRAKSAATQEGYARSVIKVMYYKQITELTK
jgi:hypothetical protein